LSLLGLRLLWPIGQLFFNISAKRKNSFLYNIEKKLGKLASVDFEAVFTRKSAAESPVALIDIFGD